MLCVCVLRYTLFYANERTGRPPMLPLWAEFPEETSLFGVDDAHLLGASLLVKPVTAQGATQLDVLFPGKGEVIISTNN